MAITTQEKAKTAMVLVAPPSRPQSSLYVGDLHSDVAEGDLMSKFSLVSPVASVHLCRCKDTGKSLCYGYVNFYSYFHALNALFCLNHSELKGKRMRLMWCQRDPSQRRSGVGNLFVKNLDPSIDSACLEHIFSPFGPILSCKVAEENGKSKGFGFVQFYSEESAVAARTATHGSIMNGRKMHVSKFVKKNQRIAAPKKSDCTKVYVENLVESITENDLLDMFSVYGKVSNVVIMRDDNGRSKGFGFVNFCLPEDAKKAAAATNGAVLGSKPLFVGTAQKKAERGEMQQQGYKENFNTRFEKLKDSNLYVKNLSESIDERGLRELFSRYGQIISAKVIRDVNGQSKGFGFVCFSDPQESKEAKLDLNGALVDGKNLYVKLAERKEDRCMKLRSYFIQPFAPSLSGFPPFCPAFPTMHQPALPQCPGAYVGIQPFLPQSCHQRFSACLPVRQTEPRKTGNTWRLVYHQPPTANIDSTVQSCNPKYGKTWYQKFWKCKGNNASKAAETSCSGPTATSLEEATCALKALLKSPGFMAVKAERPAQVPNEAVAERCTDPAVALPRSARCLGFQPVPLVL